MLHAIGRRCSRAQISLDIGENAFDMPTIPLVDMKSSNRLIVKFEFCGYAQAAAMSH